MLQVSYKIAIGAATYTSADKTRLIDLHSKASLDVPVNTCRITLGVPQDLKIAPDDSVAVELGYGKELTLIFTGIVSSTQWGIDTVTIHAASSFTSLIAARCNLLYEKSNAGDIVKDATSLFNLSSAKVESGIQFPVYALGDNQTIWEHLQTLARQCGCDFFSNHQDQVVFAKYNPKATHEFKYAANILSFNLDERTSRVTGVEVYGESPASGGQGAEAASWLTKQEVKGTAGKTSGIVVRVFDPTVRTENAAADIAQATLAIHTHQQGGKMKVLGAAQVKLGDAVKVSGMPVSQQNGTFKVTRIIHNVNIKKGFFTVIDWEDAS